MRRRAPSPRTSRPDRRRLRAAARRFLEAIGEPDLRRDQARTPERVADAWATEILSGYATDPRRLLGSGFPARDRDLVVVRDIPFVSVCVHHLLPFSGTAHVGYLPGKRLAGLSKIARVVDALSRRLQLQERLTRQVATAMMEGLSPEGVACRMEAEHLCMTIRGARTRGARVVTTAYEGAFRARPALRAEFLRLSAAGGGARGDAMKRIGIAALALVAALTPAVAAPPAQKMVRIGLTTDVVRSRITADGGVVVLDPLKRTPIWRKVFEPGLTFVAEVQGKGPLVLYRVQIGSYATEDGANQKKKALETLLPEEKVVVAYNPDRHAWRVRAGEFRTREEAASLAQRLADEGYNELWIVEEEPETAGRRRVRLVDERWHDFLTASDRVVVQPGKSGSWLKVDSNAYRGTLEVRVDKGGRLRVINILELEDYLKGVVPNEMGPGVYPELEALKAQAVAARTYIVSNLGQFGDNGYDVCDSAQCQVYRGVSTEHPLSNQAVDETRGLIAVVDGRPINALYTSTCGGHTEDGSLIFPEEKGSYLKGVTCYPEAEAEGHTLNGGEWLEPVMLEDGSRANEAVQLLRLLGIVGSEALDRSWLLEHCRASEAEKWTTFALGQVGKKPDHDGLKDGRLQMHDLVVYLTRSLGWDEKMHLALDVRDLPYLLAFRDRDQVPEEARRAYAGLILEGLLDPFPDNTLRPDTEPSRGLVLRLLYRILDYYDALDVQPATYRGFDGDSIVLESKKDAKVLPIKPGAALFRSFRDISYPAKSVALALGDRVQYHLAPDGAIDLLRLITNQRGVSDDRYSSLYRWEERRTRPELEALVRQRVDVGTLIDIEPTKRGVSGRVVEVRLKGSRGEFFLRGFRIRTAFGIKENLFTVDRVRAQDGTVESFIFSGKGWGHGVGLCQVGSYGMALRGKKYDEILRHYYTGIELKDFNSLPPPPAPGR